LRFDRETLTITFDGMRYSIENPKVFLVYQAIAEAGEPITRARLRLRVKGINNPKAVRTMVDLLPERLNETVRSGPFGFWLELPPRLPEKALL
jgi:hypothetical protein